VSQIVRYPLLVFALGLVMLWLSLDSAFRRPGTRYDQRKNLEESEANANTGASRCPLGRRPSAETG
jgi:hypothetical protein